MDSLRRSSPVPSSVDRLAAVRFEEDGRVDLCVQGDEGAGGHGDALVLAGPVMVEVVQERRDLLVGRDVVMVGVEDGERGASADGADGSDAGGHGDGRGALGQKRFGQGAQHEV